MLHQELRNNTACRTALATGIVRARSLAHVRLQIGSVATWLHGRFIDDLVAHLQKCDKAVGNCLMQPSSPEISHASFISSIPGMRLRLFWALQFRYFAAGNLRWGIFHVFWDGTYQDILEYMVGSIADSSLAVFLSRQDCIYALETDGLGGQISRMSAVAWSSYFLTSAVMPILHGTKGLYHMRALLISASFAILTPRYADTSDVAANVALAATSAACCLVLREHLKCRPRGDKETRQEAGEVSEDVVALGHDALQQAGAACPRKEGSHPSESPGNAALHGRSGSGKTTPKTADVSSQGGNTGAVEDSATEVSSPGLSGIRAFACMADTWIWLSLVHSLTRRLGGVAGEILFGSFCLCRLALIRFAAVGFLFFLFNIQPSVLQGGGTLDEAAAFREARKVYALYSAWGFLIFTLSIRIFPQ